MRLAHEVLLVAGILGTVTLLYILGVMDIEGLCQMVGRDAITDGRATWCAW